MEPTRTSDRRRPRRTAGYAAVLLLALAVAASACSSSATSSSTAGAATVTVGQSGLGSVLVDSAGRTLYAFSADRASAIVCLASCVPIWPALEVGAGAVPSAGAGLSGTLSTVTRPDGGRQVTYNGLLLYTYAGDGGPGQTKGQGVVEQYGAVKGTWSAVTPASSASGSTTTTPPPSTTTPKAPAPATTAPAAGRPTTTVSPATTAPAPATTKPAPATTAPSPPTTHPWA